MKDHNFIERLTTETLDDVQDLMELNFLRAYNVGYRAGFEAKEYVNSGHCTGCAYETVPHYKEPCKDCKNSHQNMYKTKR